MSLKLKNSKPELSLQERLEAEGWTFVSNLWPNSVAMDGSEIHSTVASYKSEGFEIRQERAFDTDGNPIHNAIGLYVRKPKATKSSKPESSDDYVVVYPLGFWQ